MGTITSLSKRQRGFTIIEALIALLVMAFGMLALAGMQVQLSRNGDYAKQRAEALRLAQDRLEQIRSYDGISSGTIQWNNLPVAAESVSANSNATFSVFATLAGTTTNAYRPIVVTVRWLDRTGQNQQTVNGFTFNQELNLTSVVSLTDPIDLGIVANPLPLNLPLRRPKNRNINIPIPAVDLGNNRSATQFDDNFAIVYSNNTGGVVQICNPGVADATAAQINAQIDGGLCASTVGYIVAGYIGRSSSGPTAVSDTAFNALGINHSAVTRTNPNASYGIRCLFGDAVDQNTNATIPNYKYYLCVVPLTDPGGAGPRWSGTIRLGGVTTTDNYVVCRYQYTQTDIDVNERNVQPYVDVNKSIDEQNYYIVNSNSGSICTSGLPLNVTGVSIGVEHQNCRTSNVANFATACPLSSP